MTLIELFTHEDFVLVGSSKWSYYDHVNSLKTSEEVSW